MLNAITSPRRIATLALATVLAAGTTACPPPEKKIVEGPKDPTPPEPKSEDLVFDGFDPIALTGMPFTPQALGRPGMIRFRPKKPTPLPRLRKQFEKERNTAKKAQLAQILVSVLWDEADARQNTDQAAEQQLRLEALTALITMSATLGDAADEYTLRMLATAQIWMGDTDAAMLAFEQFVTKHPTSKAITWGKTWLAYLHLQNGDTAKAAELVQGWTPTTEGVGFLEAYVLAWVHFRQRQYPEALAAIGKAVSDGWRGPRSEFERDLLLILARAGASVQDATVMIATYATAYGDGAVTKQYAMLYQLHDAYAFIGHFPNAIAALEAARTTIGQDLPASDAVAFLFQESNYNVSSYHPKVAAEKATMAYQGLAPCADKCTQITENVISSIPTIALFFHNIYAKTLDVAYHDAAKSLYELYGTIPSRPNADEVKDYLKRIQEHKERAQPASGKHDKETMDKAVSLRTQLMKGCYEGVLQGDHQLAGDVKITIQVDHTGKVTGVQTEPAAGDAGMAAVAGCIEAGVREWVFPGRTVEGNTAVVRSFTFTPEPREQPGGQAGAAESGDGGGGGGAQ